MKHERTVLAYHYRFGPSPYTVAACSGFTGVLNHMVNLKEHPQDRRRAGVEGGAAPDLTGVGRIIRGPDCVAEGAAHLRAFDPRFAGALDMTGPLPLRLRKDGFAALLDAIVSQQVSVAAANAIWGRLKSAKLTGPRKIKAASDEALRECGLSRQKIRKARALTEANVRYPGLRDMPTDDVITTLIEVPGIGRWTAEIYAMFSLGRADVFAPGDLALQEAARILFEMPERPSEKDLRVLSEDWAPWRAVAARLLWAYYRVAKDREGIK